jgi:hypothetical protein
MKYKFWIIRVSQLYVHPPFLPNITPENQKRTVFIYTAIPYEATIYSKAGKDQLRDISWKSFLLFPKPFFGSCHVY